VEGDQDDAGREVLCLSATGQIFHETFRERFRTDRDRVLPPPAEPGLKLAPVLHDHAVINLLRDELRRYLLAVTQEVPQVVRCVTNYCHPPCRRRRGSASGEARSRASIPTARERSSSRWKRRPGQRASEPPSSPP
jgi:hypothetical protein